MGFFIPQTPKPVAPPAPPQITDPEVEEARRRARLAEQKRRGRASTILTGGSGLGQDPSVARKNLLGE